MGGGTKNLVTNMIEAKNAAISNRVTFCKLAHFGEAYYGFIVKKVNDCQR
jgi:hypothetical protein